MKNYKPVENTNIFVCKNGDVFRKTKKGIAKAKQTPTSRGYRYRCVTVTTNGKQKRLLVHRLVATAFLPNPNNLPQVNHIDGNPSNNSVSNLEWCTAKHNIQHAYDNGLINHYRNNKVCAMCGKRVSDSNKNSLCCSCYAKIKNHENYSKDIVFFGIIEFHKKINKLSNAELAEMIGYSHKTLNDFLCGKRVTKNIKEKLCKLFCISDVYI